MDHEQHVVPIQTRRLELVTLKATFVDAIVAGDPGAAAQELRAHIGRWLPPDSSHLVRLALGARAAAAAGLPGMGRVIVLAAGTRRRAIGSVGAHSAPDERGQLEVGCRIHPAYRRHGYGAEATTGFLDWVTTRFGLSRFLLAVPSPGEMQSLVAIQVEAPGAVEPGDEIAGLAYLLEGERSR